MTEGVQAFFQGFNFDTLLALISCIVGIIALFLGGSAYTNCRKFKKSFNDKKKFGDNGSDQSIKAAGDIIYNACDTNALVSLTTENFKVSLQQTYDMFEKKTNENLHKIIDEAAKIVQAGKMQLSTYTKIDWINIYFENAKNTEDVYMQNVWAKVLAMELSIPNSFSLKTLDVLKTMTADDFKLFELLCSMSCGDAILSDDIYLKYGITWNDKIKLSEFGLLSLSPSKQKSVLDPNDRLMVYEDNDRQILVVNTSQKSFAFEIPCHLFCSSAIELQKVINKLPINEDFINDLINKLKKINPKDTNVVVAPVYHLYAEDVNGIMEV